MNALNKYISAKPPSGPSASPAMYGPGRNAPRALSAKEERVAREKEKEREKDQELEQEVERTRSQLDSDRLVLVQNLHVRHSYRRLGLGLRLVWLNPYLIPAVGGLGQGNLHG